MRLREFLYVDVQKVRGLLAQLDEGIVETNTTSDASRKTTTGGVKGIASHQAEWSDTTEATKSLGDALFPTLESALESQGLLTDLSDQLRTASFWTSGELQREYPEGSLVRITSPGQLFDSRLVARAFSNFASATVGLQNLDAIDSGDIPAAPVPPRAKRAGVPPKGPKLPKRAVPADWSPPPLEAEIPPEFNAWDLTAKSLHGIIQVSRGLFPPGLYLNLKPCDEPNHVVAARLEEGRTFLDSAVDVLFGRFGVGYQEWTLVGAIGHHGLERQERDFSQGNFLDADDNVVRSAFGEFVNSFTQYLGGIGLIDLVQAPSFSVVPLAVYRTLNPRQTTAVQPY